MESNSPNFPRIVISQEICSGKPHIKGTRIPVSSIMAYLASGMGLEDLLLEFQTLEKEDVIQAIAFAIKHGDDF